VKVREPPAEPLPQSSRSLTGPDPAVFRRIRAAPELIAVDLVDGALRALLRALALEHPALDEEPSADEAPVRARARALAGEVRRLRRSLASYRRAVSHFLDDLHRDNLPF